jgi:hypothetical protein
MLKSIGIRREFRPSRTPQTNASGSAIHDRRATRRVKKTGTGQRETACGFQSDGGESVRRLQECRSGYAGLVEFAQKDQKMLCRYLPAAWSNHRGDCANTS